MDKDTFLNSISQINNCEDEAERRTLLSNLSDEAVKIFDNQDALHNQVNSLNESLTKANEQITKVQGYNMDLYNKLDAQRRDTTPFEESSGIKEEEEKTYRSYEDIAKDFI